MIVSDACTINVSLVFALALASVVNYAHKFGASLADDSRVIIYDHNMFIVQATYCRWLLIEKIAVKLPVCKRTLTLSQSEEFTLAIFQSHCH